jgi:myo-inositol-1(or 4)-monophosphatase
MSPDLQQVLDTAILAARTGGQLALDRLGKPGFEKHKGPRDVVAGAVLDVQARIVEVIRQQFPDDHFLLEEAEAPQDEQADPLWIVDPIDGSLNFLHGLPLFAVSIAYREGGNYRVGVVYDPSRDEMFYAVNGNGAFLNGRPIQVDAFSDGREAWEQAFVGTDWRGDTEAIRKALRMARFEAGETLQLIVLGSPALGMCYVAAGRLHAYYGLEHLKLWDVAAAGLILREAGGILTDVEGASWEHAKLGYLASNNVVHGWLNRLAITVLGLSANEQAEVLAKRGARA